MTLGYRADGVFKSAPMAAGTTITKGDVVSFDANGRLQVAPANETDPAGVAAETKTSEAGDNPELAYVLHGVAGVTAAAAVSAGDAVTVGGTAGQVAPLADQAVDEGGTATYDVTYNAKVGRALEDIAADGEGDIMVGV